MMRNKCTVFFAVFIAVNAFCWTIVPALTRKILPLDTLEAIVWGSNWDCGNGKHPPLSGWIGELFYTASGYLDVSQYFLSQLLVVIGLTAVYFLGRLFLSKEESVVGSMVLLCTYLYTYTTPEYNVNVLEIAFWPLTALAFCRAVRDDRIYQWLLVGLLGALIMWTKYFSGLLLFTFFVYMLLDERSRRRFLSPGPYLAGALFFVLFLPHVRWLHLHDYAPLLYAAGRAGTDKGFDFATYLVNAFRLIPMVIGIPLPAILIAWFSYGTPSPKEMLARARSEWSADEDGRKFFLTLFFVPLFVLQILAFVGVEIRAMWYQPVFFAAGPLLVLFLRPWLGKFQWKRFAVCVTVFVLLSLSVYAVANLTHTSKRVHFPADELCSLITSKCDFHGKELILLGDYWTVGMLHCYLPSHPHAVNVLDVTWKDKVEDAINKVKNGGCVIAFAVSDKSYVRKFENLFPLKIRTEQKSFAFKAPFGKVKEKDVIYAVLTQEDFCRE